MCALAKYFSSSTRNFELRNLPSDIARALSFSATTAAVPVLFNANRFGIHAKTGELRSFAKAALDLSEAGKPGQGDDVVPQLDGVIATRQTADHRSEERGPAGRLEVQDRGADIATRQSECLLRLRADHIVERRIVQRVRQITG